MCYEANGATEYIKQKQLNISNKNN